MLIKAFNFYYRVKGGKLPARRRIADNPLVINVKQYYVTTRIGQLSHYISDSSHALANRFGSWLALRLTYYHWKRRWLYPAVLFFGFVWGYAVVCDL